MLILAVPGEHAEAGIQKTASSLGDVKGGNPSLGLQIRDGCGEREHQGKGRGRGEGWKGEGERRRMGTKRKVESEGAWEVRTLDGYRTEGWVEVISLEDIKDCVLVPLEHKPSEQV